MNIKLFISSINIIIIIDWNIYIYIYICKIKNHRLAKDSAVGVGYHWIEPAWPWGAYW